MACVKLAMLSIIFQSSLCYFHEPNVVFEVEANENGSEVRLFCAVDDVEAHVDRISLHSTRDPVFIAGTEHNCTVLPTALYGRLGEQEEDDDILEDLVLHDLRLSTRCNETALFLKMKMKTPRVAVPENFLSTWVCTVGTRNRADDQEQPNVIVENNRLYRDYASQYFPDKGPLVFSSMGVDIGVEEDWLVCSLPFGVHVREDHLHLVEDDVANKAGYVEYAVRNHHVQRFSRAMSFAKGAIRIRVPIPEEVITHVVEMRIRCVFFGGSFISDWITAAHIYHTHHGFEEHDHDDDASKTPLFHGSKVVCPEAFLPYATLWSWVYERGGLVDPHPRRLMDGYLDESRLAAAVRNVTCAKGTENVTSTSTTLDLIKKNRLVSSCPSRGPLDDYVLSTTTSPASPFIRVQEGRVLGPQYTTCSVVLETTGLCERRLFSFTREFTLTLTVTLANGTQIVKTQDEDEDGALYHTTTTPSVTLLTQSTPIKHSCTLRENGTAATTTAHPRICEHGNLHLRVVRDSRGPTHFLCNNDCYLADRQLAMEDEPEAYVVVKKRHVNLHGPPTSLITFTTERQRLPLALIRGKAKINMTSLGDYLFGEPGGHALEARCENEEEHFSKWTALPLITAELYARRHHIQRLPVVELEPSHEDGGRRENASEEIQNFLQGASTAIWATMTGLVGGLVVVVLVMAVIMHKNTELARHSTAETMREIRRAKVNFLLGRKEPTTFRMQFCQKVQRWPTKKK